MKKLLHFSVWGRIIAAFFLFWAIDRHSYGYYTLLRWFTFAVSAYAALIAYENDRGKWAWTLGIMALVFNPIVPFHLDRRTWSFIDLAAGGLMVTSTFFVRKRV